MGNRGSNGSESKSISKREHDAQVNPPLLRILLLVQLEIAVDNGGYVVRLAVLSEQVQRIERESFGIVDIQSPVGNGNDDVDDDEVADEDISDGEEGRDEGAEQEGRDDGPVQRESSDAEAAEAGADLLRGDGVGEHPTHP